MITTVNKIYIIYYKMPESFFMSAVISTGSTINGRFSIIQIIRYHGKIQIKYVLDKIYHTERIRYGT
jgi:hypothetical protein